MKHLAKVQVEFLKSARKWKDLSYEMQRDYLKRHPGSKRRITAEPNRDIKIDVEPRTVRPVRTLWDSQPTWDGKKIKIEVQVKSENDLPKTAIVRVKSDDYYETPWAAKSLKDKTVNVQWKDISKNNNRITATAVIPWTKKDGAASSLSFENLRISLETIFYDNLL